MTGEAVARVDRRARAVGDRGRPAGPGRFRGARPFCLAVLVSAAACGPSAEEGDTLGRYLMESLVLARQTADTAVLEELFAPEARYDDFAEGLEYQGIEEIVGYLTSVHEWADDVYLTLGNVRTGPSTVVGEWFLAAVQSRPITDVLGVGTNREVTLNGITLLEIEGGLITRAADYSDRARLLLDLGARIELPDGTSLEQEDPGL